MTEIKLCPHCHKKLVPMGERTGGFSGTKAVVGVVVAGPVGAAAGALGKKLVTLQCEDCGFSIEVTAKEAQEIAEFGEIYETYKNAGFGRNAAFGENTQLPKLEDIEKLGYNPIVFTLKEFLKRADERKKIGIDLTEIDAAVASATQKHEADASTKIAAKKADIQAEIGKLEQQKAELTQKLGSLGLFKFTEKKATQAEIDALNAQIKDITATADERIKKALDAELKAEIVRIRAPYVERCRELALETLDEYCPDDEDWKNLARRFYSVLNYEPMEYQEISRILYPEYTSTIQQSLIATRVVHRLLLQLGMPFVSRNENGYYFGADEPWGGFWKLSESERNSMMRMTKDNPDYLEEKYGIKL